MHAGPRLGRHAGPSRAAAVIGEALTRRAQQLAAEGAPFVMATVVRARRPASVQPGTAGIVLEDGTIEGFIGGVCAQHSVRLHALTTIESGAPLLLRIDPEGPEEPVAEEGAVTVRNTCLSGGEIEVFLEPVLPAPRVLVAGESPVAAALQAIGAELGLEVVAAHDVKDAVLTPAPGDLALVVAAHGEDELAILRAGLEAGVRYVGLVASPRRGASVLEELRAAGVAEELLGRLETPAGIDIGARTPPEVAITILARVVEVRRGGPAPAAPPPKHAGETAHSCCAGSEEGHEPARSHG
jgi:xanthine dehydrogenase accessory factor